MGSDAGLPAMHEIDRSFRRTLQAAATRLVVVSGDPEADLALGARVGALAATRGRWQVEPWAGLPIATLLERVARLGPETAVFFTHVDRDAKGPTAFPAEALPAG